MNSCHPRFAEAPDAVCPGRRARQLVDKYRSETAKLSDIVPSVVSQAVCAALEPTRLARAGAMTLLVVFNQSQPLSTAERLGRRAGYRPVITLPLRRQVSCDPEDDNLAPPHESNKGRR